MYSVSDVEEIVFSNGRTIQFWVEAGALIPSADTHHAGRGIHRAFDASEVVIGCVLRAVSQNNLPIGRLIAIAKALRDRYFIIEPGLDLVFSIDPDPKEIYEHTVAPMMVRKSRDTSSKTIVYLTPWLERAPA